MRYRTKPVRFCVWEQIPDSKRWVLLATFEDDFLRCPGSLAWKFAGWWLPRQTTVVPEGKDPNRMKKLFYPTGNRVKP